VNGTENVVLDLANGTVISPDSSNVIAIDSGPDSYISASTATVPAGCVAVFNASPTQTNGAVAATIQRFNFPAN
jgi:hypothetical protein